jgi:hypothetical protein
LKFRTFKSAALAAFTSNAAFLRCVRSCFFPFHVLNANAVPDVRDATGRAGFLDREPRSNAAPFAFSRSTNN